MLHLLALLLLTACAAPRPARLAWVELEPGVVALEADGACLLTLRHGPGEDEPALHPVALPGGPSLTNDRPADHVHHHGLWFAWKYVNGVNHWEHGPAGRPLGPTRWGPPRLTLGADGTATVALDLTYGTGAAARAGYPDPGFQDPDHDLAERRRLTAHPPAADGTWVLDWESTFSAPVVPTLLDRTPLPGEPGGQVFGGYAGLSVRLAQLADRTATTERGPVVFSAQDRARPTARAFDYAGRPEGAAAPAGIAILEHADNPRSPRAWYAIRSDAMSFFTPALLAPGPLEVRPGEPLHLAWRVVVHPGAWDAARLAAELEALDAGR